MSTHMEYSSYPRDGATMDSLERQLICPICLEMFTKPVVILPCQHNLCRKCANDIFQSRGTTLGSAGRFRCPSCRHEVVLDRHGIYGLQRNLLVENIIDVYKQASARGPERPLLKSEHPTCEEHEEEKINIYCVTCSVPTCSLCKVFGEHKECEVAPLSDIYTKQKAELTDGIGGLVAANDRIQAYIGDLQGTSRNIENNCKAQKQALGEKFDRMCAILEERRKIMLQRVTYEQENKIQHLKSLSKACSDHIEASSKLVDTALQSMEEPQMAVFVQNAKVLIQKIMEMTQNCKPEALEPGYDNMEHYMVDFNAEERILYQLDFIKIEDPEPTAEDDGASGEAEDPLAECGAAGADGREDAEDFMAFGNEEQAHGTVLLATETLSQAASEVTVTTPGITPLGTEGNTWGAPQGQMDGDVHTTSSTPPATLLDSALLSNMSVQGMGQPKVEGATGEAFSTMDSSADPEEGEGQGSSRESDGGPSTFLLNGMVSATNQNQHSSRKDELPLPPFPVSTQAPSSSPTGGTWRQEDIVQPLLSSCFNPTLWLHD